MRDQRWKVVSLFINFIVVGGITIGFCSAAYPFVGGDYSFFLPRLLDTRLHYSLNGLGVQWYSPSFGGGLPAFPNPENMQFSLPQLLTWFTDPWTANGISILCFMLVGFAATYRLCYEVLEFGWPSGLLAATFFSANGFYLQHMGVGHMTFMAFPLLPLLAVLLLDGKLNSAVAGTLAGMALAIVIYQGGFIITVIFILSLSMLLPLARLMTGTGGFPAHIFNVALQGVGWALALAAPKLYAAHSFMRFFPRQISDHFQSTFLAEVCGMALQLLGTMTLLPLVLMSGSDADSVPRLLRDWSGSIYGLWELDTAISPVLIAVLCAGALCRLRPREQRGAGREPARRRIAPALLLIGTWVTIEFILDEGVVYPLMRDLPVIRSLHVNSRFSAAFILPLALLGGRVFESWSRRWSMSRTLKVFVALNAVALGAYAVYLLPVPELRTYLFDLRPVSTVYLALRSGERFPITTIEPLATDIDTFAKGAGNLQTFQPLFGYRLEYFHPEVVAGPVRLERDGYFNMTNPSGYVFPEINNTRPFRRIPVSERRQLDDFVNRRQPDWKIPLVQRILNRLALLALFFGILLLLMHARPHARKLRLT